MHPICLLGLRSPAHCHRLESDFFDDAGEAGVAVYGPEDEADVYAYALVVARRAVYIACERFLVSVESKSYQFSFGVHHRTS